ncbi:hypothetical protein EG68_03447 [Paragonimus skrjabini miyazakii]|uniref:Uncharacterized protein n=1 Tax=Paragonimus skrjabini miyazakii TaxID=59628 RepID=A0A8S9YX17_9TREM|nr:hypothetical protein EG68_03447 [Paragonimus skrjabini miyazakii]
MVDMFRLLTICLVSLSYRIPCAISTVSGPDSAITIDQCRPPQSCSIRNNSTIWVQFYFRSTVHSVDTTSFTVCHKVIGPQQYHELCTQDFTVQRVNHTNFIHHIGMSLHVDFPSAFLGRWYTQLFNSTESLWFSSYLAINVITN